METLQSVTVDLFAHDLAEVEAAVALVATGGAVRVRIACLPGALAVAGHGVALAQAAGVEFRILRESEGPVTIEVGPRLESSPPEGS
jgi:hypothetical protein